MVMLFSQLAKFLLHDIFWECELSLLYHEQRIKQDACIVCIQHLYWAHFKVKKKLDIQVRATLGIINFILHSIVLELFETKSRP